jgi:Zn-dependent protease
VFAEPDRTQFDLKFPLFGFPVRVHPLFWLLAALLGASWLDDGLIYLLIWVAIAFVSILVHELGHAVAFRCFGVGSHIILYSFGGLAVPWGTVPARWKRIAVSLAGPAAGFLLCAAVYFSNYYSPWAGRNQYTFVLYWSLFGVNLYWGILNLLPVFPLDGGQVAREVASAFSRRDGTRIAVHLSIAVATAMAVFSLACVVGARQGADWLGNVPWWARGNLWMAILFGMLAVQNYQILQQLNWTESHWQDDDRPPWSN